MGRLPFSNFNLISKVLLVGVDHINLLGIFELISVVDDVMLFVVV